MTKQKEEFQTIPAAKPTKTDESCSKCIFDRLPPEMIRFIFRKQSTDDLLQASAITDRLYRVAQHHMYLSEGALLVRGGQDTAATVKRAFELRNVTSLYLVDVRDFDRDVPPQLWGGRAAAAGDEAGDGDGDEAGDDDGDDYGDDDGDDDGDGDDYGDGEPPAIAALKVLHVGYTRNVSYADLSADGGVRRLLRGAPPAERVCFDNVLMTADDVADAVSARLEAAGGRDDAGPPTFRCSFDRADDDAVLALLDRVQCTCAGLLAEFRVTVRRPAPRSFAAYPTCRPADDDGDGDGAAAVAAELPEDLLSLTATDCSGLGPAAYRLLGTTCPRLSGLSVASARRADDAGFEALAAMPSLRHLHAHGMAEVTSDGLLNGLERAHELRSLALADCPYVTDEVLLRAGQLRQLRTLRLDLTGCDKTTAAGVLDMLSTGCERVTELRLTVPLDADYVEAAEAAAELPQLRTFRLTFERLTFQDHADNEPAAGWQRALADRFRGRAVDFTVRQQFTRIAVTVD